MYDASLFIFNLISFKFFLLIFLFVKLVFYSFIDFFFEFLLLIQYLKSRKKLIIFKMNILCGKKKNINIQINIFTIF